MISQGAKANASGLKLENQVEDILCFNEIDYNSQVKFTGIYGSAKSRNKMDFLINIKDKSYAIECKRQMVAGSVDEKVPYVMLNGTVFPSDEFIFILEGDHFENKIQIKEWALEFAKNYKEKTLHVFSLKELNEFVTNT